MEQSYEDSDVCSLYVSDLNKKLYIELHDDKDHLYITFEEIKEAYSKAGFKLDIKGL